MILKDFQLNAVSKLLTRSKELLEQISSKKIIFKSPTGSGKTLMIAEYINRLINEKSNKNNVSFIWTTPRRTLTDQSKKKIDNYLKKLRSVKTYYFQDLIDKTIPENSILFLNWESINKINKNTIIRENEEEFYLSKVLENTKDKGRQIILIIDESHHHATSEISQKLIKDISPKLTIEVSATPVLINPDEIVTVNIEEVKLAGLIKKSVKLNYNFKNSLFKNRINSALSKGSEQFVIDEAIKKRRELKKKFSDLKSKINPLLLIQLPDNIKGQEEDKVRIRVQEYLEYKYNIKTQNGKLAIRLSEDKTNLQNIAKNDNEAEVLIFKQAIALGWDCPRAQILVLLRNWKSLNFSIQTIGRIMRMPEIKKGHYSKEILNHSYVYTNLSDISLKEDQARDYVTIYSSHTKKKIKLTSYSRIRQREQTRLSPIFNEIFLKEAKKFRLDKKIKINSSKAKISLISDKFELSTDQFIGKKIIGDKYNISSETELQQIFDFFIRGNLSPFFPEDRSVGRVKEAIYKFFKIYLKIDYEKSFSKIINIVLSNDNIQNFVDLIDIVKNKYVLETEKRKDEIKENKAWTFPENLTFTGNFTELKTKRSVMKPFYYDFKWKTEENFIKYLENSSKVEFWFKNGDRDQTFFAIPYEYGRQINLFYVDFIIKLKNGKIGLFDTKSGITIDNAKEKSDGLQKYIKKMKGKFFGGIVTNSDNENFKGRWLLFNKSSSSLSSKKLDNWENLKF